MVKTTEQAVTEEYDALFKELAHILNSYVSSSTELGLRDFLAIIATLFVDIVRMAEMSDPENAELNRHRAISYVQQLVFDDQFRNHKKNYYN